MSHKLCLGSHNNNNTSGRRSTTRRAPVQRLGSQLFWWVPIISFQLFRGVQFHCWRNPEKTADLLKVTNKMLYLVHPTMSGIRTCYFSGDSLSVNCGRSVVFSGYSGLAEILLKVAFKTITLTLTS